MDAAVAITILSRLHDAVVSIDQDQRILFFNDAAETLFGYARAEVEGQPLDILIPDALRALHRRHVDSFRAAPEQARMMATRGTLEGRRRDGTLFPAAASITKVGNGAGWVYTAVLRDMSEQRAVENQLRHAQRMDAIGQLTGGIAHDFNNLLAVMIGNLDLAKERIEAAPELGKLLDAAQASALRGAELVQRLLAFARRQTLSAVSIDLNRRLPDVVAMLQRALGDHIAIKISLQPGLWPARVDPSMVDDALLNLAINARDAMPAGGTLTIETQNVHLDDSYAARNLEAAAGDYVMIAVSDTGKGMAADVAERAFEPFFTTKGVGKGSGLGLSMVYGFVKQSGGHIKIYSEIGHGTSVKIYLPRTEDVVQPAPKPAPAPVPRGTETVLVAEDDAATRETTEHMLTSLGYRVHTAADGPSALAWIDRGEPFDLLLTDVVMPNGLSGYALAQAALGRRPGLRILLASGYAEASLRNGASAAMHRKPILTKPFSVAALARAVRRALDEPAD